jgi:hypothetical protein
VFATQEYRPGQVVGRVYGEILDDPDFSSDYCIDLERGRALDPEPPFRYVNHSCAPNCELAYHDIKDECGNPIDTEMWLQAVKAIGPGDELTIDYAWPAEATMPCGCQSPNCRGWIVAAEQVHLACFKPT